jgi:7-cyano-7-deazaguanine reductase
MQIDSPLAETPLGKPVQYKDTYTPELLVSVPRSINRAQIGITTKLPFKGEDIWNAYEISGLNHKGKPFIAIGEFRVPCTSPRLFESKSCKLYLNSFSQSRFESLDEVQRLLAADLSNAAGATVDVKLMPPQAWKALTMGNLRGELLDNQDIVFTDYHPDARLLAAIDELASETLYSNLLKSVCPVTGKPDWASIEISYTGKKIDRVGLLKYLVSFRTHDEFGEQCAERIFMDLLPFCKKLRVYIRYTRRGGIDINAWRSTEDETVENARLWRQ